MWRCRRTREPGAALPFQHAQEIGDNDMAPTAYDFGELLKGVPAGAWVAISSDEMCVVAYAAEMRDAIKAANKKGDQNPIILRVPLDPGAFLL